jgi:pyruvate/2-oxoglutarate dehydrogenase complex dihydrolipoamide dehydrogenase (E3) component
VNLGCQPKEITKNKDGSLRMKYSKGEKEEGTEDFDQILVATGRKPNSEGLGLEDVGVETDGKGYSEPVLPHC